MNQRKIDELHRITRSNPEDYEDKPDKYRVAKNIGATALVLFAIVGGAYAVQLDAKGPQYSDETIEYKVNEHGTLWNAAKTVEGINDVDIRRVVDHIEDMPENKDALSDGLQPNEIIIIPESVER